jgi:methylenetetrahydrofolate dehydrogenase (NADP+)/methenyltetrahydrofolate cyclohydrolase
MLILDGKNAREEIKKALIEKVKGLMTQPHLVIIQVGERGDSEAYIKAKRKFAVEIGARETHIKLAETASETEIIRAVENANADPRVHGIIVQLPLPLSIDANTVMNVIDPQKDVDGLTAINVEKWMEGREDAIWPATTRGIREILNFYDISLEGKKVAMLGRSTLVGKPTAAMCVAENATVTICNSKTPNTAEITRAADIIIVAIGKPRLIDDSYINIREGKMSEQVIIDVGINLVDGKLVGDVDYDLVAPALGDRGAITPVPGGVGQMTVLALFENLIDACYNQNN